MAKLNPQRLKSLIIDGETVFAPENASISDVVPVEVNAVTVYDQSGKSQLLTRNDFQRPLPEGFTTHLTHVAKGAPTFNLEGAVAHGCRSERARTFATGLQLGNPSPQAVGSQRGRNWIHVRKMLRAGM